jgi:hypothetical protein
MAPSTAPRMLGALIAAAWAAQFGVVAISTYLSAHAVGVPLNAWFFLAVHLVLAAVGVAAGLLAIRGARAWKWLALVSGLALFISCVALWRVVRDAFGRDPAASDNTLTGTYTLPLPAQPGAAKRRH